MKSLKDALHEVDPNLKVIAGGNYNHTHKMSARDFDAATGIICPQCHREVFRSKEGMCLECWNKKYEYQIIDTTGYLEFLGDDILKDITVKRGGG